MNGKADKGHTHDEYITRIGVNSKGVIQFYMNGKWLQLASTAPFYRELAFKDHKHPDLIDDVFTDRGHLVVSRNGTGYRVGEPFALANHTHSEYLKKGDPIELTPEQKAELKGADGKDGLTTFIRYANNPSGTNMTASPKSDTTHIGIFSSRGQVPPPVPSVYQWTRIKGEDGKPGNPGTPGKNGTSITTWVGTQSQYDRIYSKSDTTLYLIKG